MPKIIWLLFFFFFISTISAQTIRGNLNFCQGQSTTLAVTGAPAGATYQWQSSTDGGVTWIDISLAGTANTYVVNTPASYRVNVNGTPTQQVDVIQNPLPITSFSFLPNSQCSNVPIVFSNTSSGAASVMLIMN